MTESIKLEQQELEQLTQIQKITQNIVLEYGNIELLRKNLDTRTKKADEALKALREREQEIASTLQEKYGQGSIDLDNGTFTPMEE